MKIQLTYLGRILNNKHKIKYRYKNSDNHQIEWYSKKLQGESLGAIIECTKTETGVKAPYVFKGRLPQSAIDELTEKDWAVQKEYELLREIKKVSPSRYKNLVTEINLLIYDLSPAQKKLFKMKLILDLK